MIRRRYTRTKYVKDMHIMYCGLLRFYRFEFQYLYVCMSYTQHRKGTFLVYSTLLQFFFFFFQKNIFSFFSFLYFILYISSSSAHRLRIQLHLQRQIHHLIYPPQEHNLLINRLLLLLIKLLYLLRFNLLVTCFLFPFIGKCLFE